MRYIISSAIRASEELAAFVNDLLYFGKGGDGAYVETDCPYTYDYQPLKLYDKSIHDVGANSLSASVMPAPLYETYAGSSETNHMYDKLLGKCRGKYEFIKTSGTIETYGADGYWKDAMRFHEYENFEDYGGAGAIVISW